MAKLILIEDLFDTLRSTRDEYVIVMPQAEAGHDIGFASVKNSVAIPEGLNRIPVIYSNSEKAIAEHKDFESHDFFLLFDLADASPDLVQKSNESIKTPNKVYHLPSLVFVNYSYMKREDLKKVNSELAGKLERLCEELHGIR